MGKDKQYWSVAETISLLKLWSSLRQQLDKATRTKESYEEIQRSLAAQGHERELEQIVNKIKKLKMEFREMNRSELDRNYWLKRNLYFDFLEKAFGSKEEGKAVESDEECVWERSSTDDMEKLRKIIQENNCSLRSPSSSESDCDPLMTQVKDTIKTEPSENNSKLPLSIEPAVCSSDFKIEYVVTEDDFISFTVPPPRPVNSDKWVDAEVQALLSLYGTKKMERDFMGQKHNMRIFDKISSDLASIGIHHSTKQCREKIKKLKQDYKKIKDINESGAEFKKSKWFNIMDSILGRGPDYSGSPAYTLENSSMEPLDSILSEHNTETRGSTEDSAPESDNNTMQLSIDPVLGRSGLKIGCVVSEAEDCSSYPYFSSHLSGPKMSSDKWLDAEVKALLSFYATKEMERDSEGQTNTRIFEKISIDLANIGIHHSAKHCREKIKKLKQDYRKIKEHNKQNGAENKTSKWYDILDSILGHLPAYSGSADTRTDHSSTEPLESLFTENSTDTTDSMDHFSKSSQIQPCLDRLLGSTHVAFASGDASKLASAVSNRPSGHVVLDSIWPATKESNEVFKMSNDKWHDAEVQAFLNIYAKKKMEQDAEGVTQTKIFPGISRELAKIGIYRTARHCREKIKKLKQDYRRIKSHNESGAQFKKSKWFNILDSILGHDLSYSASDNSSMEPLEENHTASTDGLDHFAKLCQDQTFPDVHLGSVPHTSPALDCLRGRVDPETMSSKTKSREAAEESVSEPEVRLSQLPLQRTATDRIPCPPAVRNTAFRFRPVKRKRKESSELVECLERMHEQHLQQSRDMHEALLNRMDTHMSTVIGLLERMATAMETQAKQPRP